MNNDKKLDELQKEIDALKNRVENLKREIERRDNIFISSIPDDHIPVDHYW
jgi:peptidoglycan hydrolase CwlO-like protein